MNNEFINIFNNILFYNLLEYFEFGQKMENVYNILI